MRRRRQARQASELLRRCEASGDMFTDELFPADRTALDRCTGAGEVRRWCRPVETWEEGEPSFFQARPLSAYELPTRCPVLT